MSELPPNCTEDERGIRTVGPGGGLRKQMPNPTPMDLVDPVFNAIWEVTKTWDVNAPEYYAGYCGLNGSHVMLILNAVRASLPAAEDARDALLRSIREAMVVSMRQDGIPTDWNHMIAAIDAAMSQGSKGGGMKAQMQDPWMGLFWKLSLEIKCLPSTFVDGNAHVFRKVAELKQQHDELERSNRELREALDAACAFIDSHRADPDLSQEMVRNYTRFCELRAALSAADANKGKEND